MISKFSNPLSRVSIVTFNGNPTGQLLLSLQADSAGRKAWLDSWTTLQRSGSTYIGAGIQTALENYRDNKVDDNRPAIFFIVTDGGENAVPIGWPTCTERAAEAKNLGIVVFSIGVGSVSKTMLDGMASTPSSQYSHTPPSFSDLVMDSMFSLLVDRTCLQASIIDPNVVCQVPCGATVAVNTTDPYRIAVRGRGFINATSAAPMVCSFANLTMNALVVRDDLLYCLPSTCKDPQDAYRPANASVSNIPNGRWVFEVKTINGLRRTYQSNITIEVTECVQMSSIPPIWGMLLVMSIIPVIFLSYLCWSRRPTPVTTTSTTESFMSSVVTSDSATKPGVLPPAKDANGKWAQVDTSKYIWASEGGAARPLNVQWGELGPTQAAAHLEATTMREGMDPSKTVEMSSSSGENTTTNEDSSPSCWSRFCGCCRRPS
eukprot:TRINITY_DN8882_c0_g1_i1.p1 TRINITY_DN8882_c0_g1~~TRINITY_DN8882_c0_g1_i1.p1  ORF type:complete len:505 (+),score=79.87 TRINITY_DN8882_c0_g1_i1:220-1515(+)